MINYFKLDTIRFPLKQKENNINNNINNFIDQRNKEQSLKRNK